MTLQQPKRGRGRPRNPISAERGKRRFFMLEKNDRTVALMKKARANYRVMTGKEGADAQIIRAALWVYGNPELARDMLEKLNETNDFGGVELDPISGLPEYLFRNDDE